MQEKIQMKSALFLCKMVIIPNESRTAIDECVSTLNSPTPLPGASLGCKLKFWKACAYLDPV